VADVIDFQKSLRLLTTDGTSLWFHSSPSLLIYQIEYIKERRSFPSMHMFRKSVNSCILYALKLLLNQCMQNYYPYYATLLNSMQNARLALFIDNARSVTIQIVHFMSISHMHVLILYHFMLFVLQTVIWLAFPVNLSVYLSSWDLLCVEIEGKI